MKKVFKFIVITLLFLLAVIFIFGYSNHESLPTGKQPQKADVLAHNMLKALNKEAFDTAKVLEWSFKGSHHYKWYKQENRVIVSWGANKVDLYTKTPKKTIVYINGAQTDNKEIVAKAIQYFNNDSFWLIAPYKVFDTGTKRSIVKHNNKEALLIEYTSGGSTPGDSYLWVLNQDYIPTSYKMWVGIIPIGGLEATWDDWIVTEAGCKLPTNHTLNLIGMQINMGAVKATK